jgi:hypothetical protein
MWRAKQFRRAVIICVLLIAIVGILWAAFGLNIEVGQRRRFDTARSVWNSSRPASYQMIVNVVPDGEYKITVRDGKAVEVAYRPRLTSVLNPSAPFETREPESAAKFTIDQLFDQADRLLGHPPEVNMQTCFAREIRRTELDFDPTLGYLRAFYLDNCQTGLLCPAISECRWGYRVVSLEPIP